MTFGKQTYAVNSKHKQTCAGETLRSYTGTSLLSGYLLLACANHSSMIYVNQLDELVDEMGNTGNNTGR